MAKYEGCSLKLSAEAWRFLEDKVANFESAWSRGERPEISEYRPAEAMDPTGGRLLLELVHTELEFRIEAGEPARVEEYVNRFPELAERAGAVADLAAAEIRLRRPFEPRLGRGEYGRRFPTLVGRIAAALESADTIVDRASCARPAYEIVSDRTYVPGFELVRVLGRGGMGVVHEARDLSLGRSVAIKVVHADSDPSANERLRREAEAVAGLRHPNVVEVYRTGRHAGGLFIVMELLPGGTLAERINGTPLPAIEAAAILEPIARAIAGAHAKGLIHRDLKPANVLFAADGTPKVADFGLAKRLDDDSGLTKTGTAAGSPSYMAPEQALARGDVGAAADVWALGAVLYDAVTGRPPFRGVSAVETLEFVRSGEPVPPRRLVPRLPQDIETVCLKCLEKDPNRRYATAADLADDLGRFNRGEPVRARPVSPVEKCVRWVTRNRAVAGLLVMLWASLAGATVASVRHAARESALAKVAESNLADAVQSAKLAASRERFGRRLLFASDMRLAADAIRDGDAARADELLAGHTEPSTGGLGFVRNYLHRMTHVPETRIGGDFGGAIHDIRLSPNGETLAAGGESGEVRLFDYKTLNLRSHWMAGQGELNGLSFSPDSASLATAGEDGTVALWKATAGGALWQVKHFDGAAHSVAFGLDGRILAACGEDRNVRLLDPASGRELATLEADGDPYRSSSGVEGISVTPDGNVLIACGRTRPSAWNLETHTPLWEHSIIPAGNRFTSVACSPDGRFAAFGTPQAEVLVADVKSGERLHFGPVLFARPTSKGDAHRRVAFLQSNMIAVGCDSGAVRLAQVTSGGLEPPSTPARLAWQAHSARIQHIGRLTDGIVVTASRDGEVSAWRPEGTPAWRAAPVGPHEPSHLRSTSDDELQYGASAWVRHSGRDRLVSVRDDGVSVIDPNAGDSQHVPLGPGEWRYATSLADGPRAFFMAGSTLAAWDFGGPKPVELWRRESDFANGGKVGPGSTDGRVVAAVLSYNIPDVPTDYWLALFDAETGGMLCRRKLRGPVCPPVITPDGSTIAMSSGRQIFVLAPASLATSLELAGHEETVHAVAFSADGRRLASSGLDGRLILWDLNTGRPVRAWRADVGHVRSLVFSRDGRVLLSSTQGLPPRFWDTETGRLLLEPAQPLSAAADDSNWIGAVFSSNGTRVAAGGGRQVAIFYGGPLER